MQFLNIFLSSVGSIIVLFLLTKLIGNKEMSQLSMFDYVNSITIGSIAAEMATSLEGDFFKPLLAMVIYGAAALLISICSMNSIKFRRLVGGKALVLLENDKIYMENLKQARIDVNEFLTQCRVNGYFDISDIQTAIWESNGKLSILPKAVARPVTPQDANLEVAEKKPGICVILDGNIMERNLRHTGNDHVWLEKQLRAGGVGNVRDVFLATCGKNNALNIYLKLPDKPQGDMFQ